MIHIVVDSVLAVKWHVTRWESVAEVTHTLATGSGSEEEEKTREPSEASSDWLLPARLFVFSYTSPNSMASRGPNSQHKRLWHAVHTQASSGKVG